MKFIVEVTPIMENPRIDGEHITVERFQAWLQNYQLAENISFEMSLDPDDPFMEGEHGNFVTFQLVDTKVEVVTDDS